ncbi:CZB domain-containing protein [Undibacterium luofuense]|uniref:CZB domain-containing protein n=1 Tax=Undibacterium luofuense TaxID=2828733 RepID=A0A941I6H3_9BURK|nr:CZB domain-containing protein [Undibacterium luofuense]MBR7782681.1 CZB domain-containing protein [Undibacterium luofuense]
MDLDNAVAKHAEWKVKFRKAITAKEQLDADTIAKDNCCDLGKWLHGESRTKIGGLASYKDCVSRHANFHVEAGKVAKLINKGAYSEAEKALDAGTSYATASSAVSLAIGKLKKEAGM